MRLHFRKGIRFHDDPCFPEGKGRELVAEDFVDMMKRHIDPNSGSFFYEAYVAGRFAGVDELRERAVEDEVFDYQGEIAGIRAVSRFVVELRMTRPYPQFLPLLTMPWASLIPREAVLRYGSGLSQRMIGSGPYLHDGEGSTKTVLSFKPNPSYVGESIALPANDGLIFEIVPKPENHNRRFRNEDSNLLQIYNMNSEEYVNPRGRLMRDAEPRGARLVKTDIPEIRYITFNFENKLLAKKNLRQALLLAVDRKAYGRRQYLGRSRVPEHFIPPSLPLDLPEPLAEWDLAKSDRKRAEKLLAEAGHPKGEGLPEFLFDLVADTQSAVEEAEWIARQWKRIGVRVQIRPQKYAKFVERQRAKQTQISMNHWFADYADADNFLFMLTTECIPQKDKMTDSPNTGRFSNAEYDELYRQTTVLSPGPERGKIIKKMLEIFHAEVPWVPLSHPQLFTVKAPRVKGFVALSPYARSYARIRR